VCQTQAYGKTLTHVVDVVSEIGAAAVVAAAWDTAAAAGATVETAGAGAEVFGAPKTTADGVVVDVGAELAPKATEPPDGAADVVVGLSPMEKPIGVNI
jgi:hypothetical protein